MQILSPLSSKSEVQPLIEAGANELYCGVVASSWLKRYTYIGSVNLRHDKAANLPSFKELSQAVKIAGKHDIPVFVAFNAHFYSQRQLPAVLSQVKEAVGAGADSLIIADPILIKLVRQKFPSVKISLSTGQPCFNSKAILFFKQLGVERIVLPRHLTAWEAEGLARQAKKAGIETEAFVLNVICPFIDGLCTFQHIVEPSQQMPVQPLACRAGYAVSVCSREAVERQAVAAAHAKIWGNTLSYDCGLCALPYFLKARVSSLKIAGRANSLHKKIADILAVKEAIALAKKLPRKKFLEEASRLYFDLYKRRCQCINCYYPTAGKWKT